MNYLKVFISVVLLYFANNSNGQIKNLVFEGAGIRGLCYSGSIKVLEEYQLLDSLEKVGGTSAGAITSVLLAVGYNSDEIADIVSSTKFQKFNDGRFFFIGGILRMKNRYGWYRGKKFLKWLDKLIADKTGNGNITFEKLHLNDNYLDLYCVTTSLADQRELVLSYENYPDMRIKDAVRASMSIPLYFGAVFMDEKGKIYNKPPKEKYKILIDGGITGNYPIYIFDEIKENERIYNVNTIGFRIDSDEQTLADAEKRELIDLEIDNLKDFISALYIYTIENLNRSTMQKEDWDRTISVSSGSIGPKIKKLTESQKMELIKNGEIYTRMNIEKLNLKNNY